MLPALALLAMERTKILPKAFLPLTMLQMSLFFMKLSIAVPLGTAFYPQMGTIQASDLEGDILKQYAKTHGQKIPDHFQYNKGL